MEHAHKHDGVFVNVGPIGKLIHPSTVGLNNRNNDLWRTTNRISFHTSLYSKVEKEKEGSSRENLPTQKH